MAWAVRSTRPSCSRHLGQRVIHHLLETLKVAPQRLIATTRKPETLKDLAAKGVTVRAADLDDTASLRSAFAGAERLLLINTDALDRPGRRLAQHQAAIAAAEQAGVAHVVYTSVPLPENSPLMIAPDHAGTEQALASDATSKTTYTLSGAEAFTTERMAQQVSQATGKPPQVVHVPLAGLIQGMLGAGLPEPMAAVFASFDTNTAAGRVADVTGDFQKLTGVAPQPFAAWLGENEAALAGQ